MKQSNGAVFGSQASVRAGLQGKLGIFQKIIFALKYQLRCEEAFTCASDDLSAHNHLHYFSNEPTAFFVTPEIRTERTTRCTPEIPVLLSQRLPLERGLQFFRLSLPKLQTKMPA